jgi:hypothetical protein
MSVFSSIPLLKTSRAFALAAVIAVGFSGVSVATEHGEEDPLTREELLAAALAGDPAARSALVALFGDLTGDSEAIAALAIELIGSLEGDPVAITDAAILIFDVASDTLNTQPIVRVAIDNDFQLPPGAIGWDLGSPGSPVFPGFNKLTQGSKGIVGGASGGMQRPGGKGLLSDGLIGIRRIVLDVDVPDGTYRLILMTDDQGNQFFVNPLGRAITVNGVRTIMNTSAPDSWSSNGVLGGTGDPSESSGFGGTGTGGATVIYVQVVNGRLVIEFEAAENSEILLTGFVLEPADGPSVLFSPEESFTNDNEILFAEALIADAIGETLEEIAVAAGPGAENPNDPDLVDELTDLPDALSPS